MEVLSRDQVACTYVFSFQHPHPQCFLLSPLSIDIPNDGTSPLQVLSVVIIWDIRCDWVLRGKEESLSITMALEISCWDSSLLSLIAAQGQIATYQSWLWAWTAEPHVERVQSLCPCIHFPILANCGTVHPRCQQEGHSLLLWQSDSGRPEVSGSWRNCSCQQESKTAF